MCFLEIKRIFLIIIAVILVGGVKGQTESPEYSFFTAGHTYGSPDNTTFGLYYPFDDYIPKINNYPSMELGFLTGDVVVHPTIPRWDSVQEDIDKFNMPIYIAAGNHDLSEEFVARFGPYYYNFFHKGDLFIILTPGLDSWNISGDQLDFLKRVLEENYTTVKNVFIILHELIWWSPTNEYSKIKINAVSHYPGSSNYQSEIEPLLLSYPNHITIYAGDLGCYPHVTPFMYHSYDNITLIGSGMGGGLQDNFIITDVYKDSIDYRLIALNGQDSTALGELENYSTLSKHEISLNREIKVYPNPASDILTIELGYTNSSDYFLYNLNGQLIESGHISGNSKVKIDLSRIDPGFYFMQLINPQYKFNYKIVVE